MFFLTESGKPVEVAAEPAKKDEVVLESESSGENNNHRWHAMLAFTSSFYVFR